MFLGRPLHSTVGEGLDQDHQRWQGIQPTVEESDYFTRNEGVIGFKVERGLPLPTILACDLAILRANPVESDWLYLTTNIPSLRRLLHARLLDMGEPSQRLSLPRSSAEETPEANASTMAGSV